MDVQLRRGVLEACVLASLCAEDSYGYKMIKDVSPYVEISESTLYPILKRLESAECVSVYSMEHNGRLRKYYHLTESGQERIGQFIDDWQEINGVYEYIKEEFRK